MKGHVVDSVTGADIAGAEIRVYRMGDGTLLADDVQTDATGRFEATVQLAVSAEPEPITSGGAYEIESIFPSPATPAQAQNLQVHYRTPLATPRLPEVELFDAVGRRVHPDGRLASGIYFVRLRFEDGATTGAQPLTLLGPSQVAFQLVNAGSLAPNRHSIQPRMLAAASAEVRVEVSRTGYQTLSRKVASQDGVVDEKFDLQPLQQMTLEGAVYAPADASSAGKGGDDSAALNGEAPLPGATVRVYDLRSYLDKGDAAEILASATTEADGSYSASDLPLGADLIVVVEADPRLTAIILGRDADDRGRVNTSTTLTAEHLANQINAGRSVSRDRVRQTEKAADEALGGMSAADLAGALDALLPETFGSGFPDDLPAEFRALVDALNATEMLACTLELSTSSARPGSTITMSGLPAELGQDLVGWLYATGRQARHLAIVERTEGDEAELVVPVHPENFFEGGAAKFVVASDGEQLTCPAIEFEVEALPRATGTFSSVIDDFESILVSQAEALGFERNELLEGDLHDMPAEVAVLAGGLRIIDGPDYENSLRRILSGEAEVLGGEPIDKEILELIDAVMASSGLPDLVAELPAILQGGGAAGKRLLGDCSVRPSNISMPAELDCWMNVQAYFEDANTGWARTTRDVTGGLLGATAIVATAFGALPVAAAAGASATAVLIMELTIDAMANTLPSELVGLAFAADPVQFAEDAAVLQGQWEASYRVASNGWTLDWPTVVASMPGLGRLAGPASRTRNPVDQLPELVEFVESGLKTVLRDVWNEPKGPISEPSRVFGVDVDPSRSDERDYFDWEIETLWSEHGADAFLFETDATRYRAHDVGESVLTVRTQGGRFNGLFAEDSADLEVNAIEVEVWEGTGNIVLGTSPIFLGAGDDPELYLRAGIRNAEDPELTWRVDGGTIEPYAQHNVSAIYTAPGEPGTYRVTVESASRTGLRADGEPERSATMLVVVGSLIVGPGLNCMEIGDTHQFSAMVAGEEISFSELAWEITGPGSLSSQGVYSATAEGEVKIEFWHRSNEDNRARVSFRVRETCPYFSLVATGDAQFSWEGTCGYINVLRRSPPDVWDVYLGRQDGPLQMMLGRMPDLEGPEEWAETVSRNATLIWQGRRWSQTDFTISDPPQQLPDGVMRMTWTELDEPGSGTSDTFSGTFSGYFTSFFHDMQPTLIHVEAEFRDMPQSIVDIGCEAALPGN